MSWDLHLNWKREVVESILIFVFGGLIQIMIWCDSCFTDTFKFTVNLSYSGMFWVLLWKGSQYIVAILDGFYSWLEAPVKRFFLSATAVVAYTTVVVLSLNFIFDYFVFRKSFDQSVEELWDFPLAITIIVTLLINAFMHGRGFLFEWRESSINIEKIKTKQVSTQYESLKNQVNPHFLFNSLNALTSLVYDDQDKAVDFIRKLSKVYRYVLDRKDEELVSLKDEVLFMENFVFLQQIRFGDNLKIEFLNNQVEGYIPPLALQILVENAIKHNVISEKDPLTINIELADGVVTVTNNIKEKLDKDSTGIGLNNLKARYGYLTSEEVKIDKIDGHFRVQLPILLLKG